MRKYFCLYLIGLLIPGLLFADNSSSSSSQTNSAINAPIELPGYPPTPQYTVWGFKYFGHIEGAFNYLSQSRFFTSGVQSRFTDVDPNGFIFNQAALTIARQPEQGFGGLLDVIIGRDAYSTLYYGMNPGLDSQNAGFDVLQAYLQYAVSSFTFILGEFYTLAGYESVDPTQNPNYSNTYIASYAQPTAVTGGRLTYAANTKLKMIFGVNDGWINIRDWSRRKTLEFGTTYTDDKYFLSASWYNGQERAVPFTDSGPLGMRNLVDLIASVNVTDKLTLVVNYDFATQSKAALSDGTLGRANWGGIAGYVNYQINTKWRWSIRGDYFIDRDGFPTQLRQNLKELTVTVGYLVFKNFELRAETRRDLSSTNAFQGKDGSSTSNNMQSVALAGVLTF